MKRLREQQLFNFISKQVMIPLFGLLLLSACSKEQGNATSTASNNETIDSSLTVVEEILAAGTEKKAEPFMLGRPGDFSLNRDSIYQELLVKAQIKQENWAHFFKAYADTFQLDTNCRHCFPNEAFDQVYLYRMNEEYFETYDFGLMKNEVSTDSILLSNKEARALYNFTNNPTNFDWAECGTAISKYLLKFFKQNQYVGNMRIACKEGQVSVSGKNEGDVNLRLIKYGGVKSSRVEALRNILLNNRLQYNSGHLSK